MCDGCYNQAREDLDVASSQDPHQYTALIHIHTIIPHLSAAVGESSHKEPHSNLIDDKRDQGWVVPQQTSKRRGRRRLEVLVLSGVVDLKGGMYGSWCSCRSEI